MLKKKEPASAILCLPLIMAALLFPQDKSGGKTGRAMTLRECIARALANNLDLAIEAFNPDINREALAATKEKYLPQFNLAFNAFDQNQPGTWGVEGTSVLTKTDAYSLSLSERIVTGTTASLSFSSGMSDTSRAFTVINPSYNSSFSLSLTQPLLRGFGPKINRIDTLQAENLRDISVSALKSKVIETVYDVEEAYWSLYSALENWKVQEESLEQSRALLKKNQEAVRIGAKSALDILNSETEVAQYVDALVQAQQIVEQSEARLKRILNLPVEAQAAGGTLIPADKPAIDKKDISYEEAVRIALAERPEMSQSEKELENYDYSLSYYRNDLLPQLDLTFSTWSPGQSGVKYLYDNDNPFTGSVIGKVEGSRMDAFREALRRTYKNWSLKLNLSIPFGNIFARSNLAKAKIEREKAAQRQEQQRQAIAYEIAEAIKSLQNAGRKVESSRASCELQEKRVAAETQRYQLGLAGSEWLLSYQRQLTNARTSEIRAMIDSKLAAARLEKAMGTTLRTMGLKFRDYDF
jgi:outer membrane protein TolC